MVPQINGCKPKSKTFQGNIAGGLRSDLVFISFLIWAASANFRTFGNHADGVQSTPVSDMLLVLTKKSSARVTYTMELIFRDHLGIPVRVIQDAGEYLGYEGPKLAYGVEPPDTGLYFASDGLLFESGIAARRMNYLEFKGKKAFFAVFDQASLWPFDPFAAIFFLVTRYEEYLPHILDAHGRFSASSGEGSRNGFLRKPLVNHWIIELGTVLKDHFPGVKFRTQKYSFVPTFDIDTAWAYRHKGMTRTLGGLLKSMRYGMNADTMQRIHVLLGREKDPFDTFDYLFRIQKEYALNPIYFILMADYGENDKNIPVNNRHFIRLIRQLSDYAQVGIHPSYASSGDPARLSMEIARLAKVLRQDVTMSRQHFLRLSFPTTYRNLINQDITDDYTMGFAEEPGFRASICTPYRYYDIDLDRETPLWIHPFAVMDGTLSEYMKLSPGQAIEVVTSLIREVKAVNGVFTPLWHNQALNDQNEWKGWKEVFEKTVKLAVS